MRQKTVYIIFSLLFLLMCAVPVTGMALLGPSEAGANEVLATAPVLYQGDGFNWRFFEDLTDYVGDRFALRQELITADATLTAALLGESRTERVLLGENGWLYYADTLADYQGTAPMTERELWCAARTLALMQDYVQAQGAVFLFVSPPNKNTLYPEHMPTRFARSDVASNWQRLTAYLDAAGVAYCDLMPVLAAADEPVYYRTDSHWDGYGSALAHDAIIAALNGEGSLAKEKFAVEAYRGDLYEMLFPAGSGIESGRVLARARDFTYRGAVRGPNDQTIHTESQGKMGTLLMFRDSFGNLLHKDLAESFSSAVFSRAMPVRMDLLEEEGTVIFELVERNLYDLVEKPPVMEGIPCEAPEVSGEVEANLIVQQTQSRELPALTHYTGRLNAAALDVDSSVILMLDGTAYEAVPTAAGFSLYAPPATEVEVFILSGGQWRYCY